MTAAKGVEISRPMVLDLRGNSIYSCIEKLILQLA